MDNLIIGIIAFCSLVIILPVISAIIDDRKSKSNKKSIKKTSSKIDTNIIAKNILKVLNSVSEKKKLVTIFGLYELVVLMILSYKRICLAFGKNFLLSNDMDWCYKGDYTGYLIACIVIPAIFGLFLYWRKDFNISDHTMNIIENTLIIMCLIALIICIFTY